MKNSLPFVFLLLVLSPTLAYDDDDDYEGDKHKKWWSTPLIMVVYLGIFLIAATVSLCIRHFRDRRFLLDFLNNHQREADRGLKAEEIDSLPSLRYSEIKSKGRINGKDELECAICLAEFKEQEVVRILPGCYHVFHPSCIAPWLASHVTCPICRSSLEHKQGSSVSINSILNGISGHLSQRFDQSDSQRDADHDDDHHHVTVEIEGSSTLHSEENLDDHHQHHPQVTSGTRKLPKSYSTGDITVQMLEKCTSSFSSLSSFMLQESSPKSDYRPTRTTTTINNYVNWSCIFSKSDRFVDYSSLMLVHMKGTVVMSAGHESPSSSQSYVGQDRHDGRLVTGV